MVVINWIKDTFGQGSKRFLYSIGYSASSVASKIKNSLVSEQRALAEHYYNSHINFTAKLEDLTEKIKEFDNSNSAGVSYIEKKQQELLFACLRMETALKTTVELKRERKEWERRLPSNSPIDILHPLARLELINSELRIREQDFSHLSPARTESTPAQTIEVLAISQEESALKPSKTRSVAIGRESIYTNDDEDLPSEYLIKQAASIIAELSTSQQTSSNNQEYLQKIAELRDLHATLKRSSRTQSHFRYRTALRNRLAKIFY